MSEAPRIHYLNTDLDLIAPVALDDLLAALRSLGVDALHASRDDDGNWWSTLETQEEYFEPDSNIAAVLTAIESLPPLARQLWNACQKREFNVGYDCGDEPWAFNQGLSNDTLRRMAECGATFRLTLYPYREDDRILSRES